MTEIKELGARLTVVQSIYYQSPGLDANQRETKYSVEIDQDEQPYYRQLILKSSNSEPTSIETGWVEDVGTLLIENLEGKFTQVQPTEDEREDVKGRIIELQMGDCTLLIRPGDCQRLTVKDQESLRAISLRRSSGSPIKYSITVYSR